MTGAGRSGAAGAAGVTAGLAGGECAAARCRCLEDSTAAETTGRKRRSPAMAETAVQVQYMANRLPSHLCFLDFSDYIGCYERNDQGVFSDGITSTSMTICYCIGYCASLNYSLAGLNYRQVPCHKTNLSRTLPQYLPYQ